MTPEQIIAELERYESELTRIYSNFSHTHSGIHIAREDDPLYRQYVRELIDFYSDALGPNVYSIQIAREYSEGFGYMGQPSLTGVENVLGVVRTSITRMKRNSELLIKRLAEETLRHKENIFIVQVEMKQNGGNLKI